MGWILHQVLPWSSLGKGKLWDAVGLSQAHDLDLSHLIQGGRLGHGHGTAQGEQIHRKRQDQPPACSHSGQHIPGWINAAVEDGKEQGQPPWGFMKHHQGSNAELSLHVNEFSWNYTAKTVRIRDLFYFWAFQQLSILPGKQPAPRGTEAAGSAPHIPADTNSLPRDRLDFGTEISAVSSRRSCPAPSPASVFPQGWMGLGALAKGTGICRHGGEEEEGKKKPKCAKEMNQLLQGSLPELIPILLFPRRKAVAGKRGRKDFLPLHPGNRPLSNQLDKSMISGR